MQALTILCLAVAVTAIALAAGAAVSAALDIYKEIQKRKQP